MVQLGNALRRARMKYVTGLRELAREEDLSAEFLSAIELGKAKAPESVLKVYAKRFRLDITELMRLAGRIPTDLKKHLLKSKKNMERARENMRRNQSRQRREMKKVSN